MVHKLVFSSMIVWKRSGVMSAEEKINRIYELLSDQPPKNQWVIPIAVALITLSGVLIQVVISFMINKSNTRNEEEQRKKDRFASSLLNIELANLNDVVENAKLYFTACSNIIRLEANSHFDDFNMNNEELHSKLEEWNAVRSDSYRLYQQKINKKNESYAQLNNQIGKLMNQFYEHKRVLAGLKYNIPYGSKETQLKLNGLFTILVSIDEEIKLYYDSELNRIQNEL